MEKIIATFKDVILNKYAKFSGRSSLAEYWIFFLATIILNIIISILSCITFIHGLMVFLKWAVSVALIVPNLAIGVRRLHDIGKGGGWICINFVPLIGWIWFIILMVQKGEAGSNRFGNPE